LLYTQLGYERIALGGLVPLSDQAILEIVKAVSGALHGKHSAPRVHLFGVFRPKLQPLFRELGVSSFDSATYFRKAWLRSGQNYLSKSGDWYAAIRVPMTSDGRTRQQLLRSGVEIEELEALEKRAISALHAYGSRTLELDETLAAIQTYDKCLPRSSEDMETIRAQYEKTLKDRPWEHCGCSICRDAGINVLIFRGSNRNKRRGAHNTARLFESVCQCEAAQ
jgi:6-pyruvoyl tetrahydropterin synthase/QueD family protein